MGLRRAWRTPTLSPSTTVNPAPETTMNHSQNPSLGASQQSRLLALSLSAVFTLSMLLGIQTLAEMPDHAAQMAHVVQPRA
jgi:hypothetical protein